MATTFSTIYQDPMLLLTGDTTDATLATYVKRWANRRYKRICAAWKWPFMKDEGILDTIAEYTTGTIATDGTTGITGTDSVWTTAMAGRKFKSDVFNEIYKIASRTSDTAIVLDKAFNGDDETEGTYTIFQDEYQCPINWADILNIWHQRGRKKLSRISLNEYRSRYLGAAPQNADPLYYALHETKSITKIIVDGADGTAFQVDEVVTQATSNAYGILRGFDSATAATALYIEIQYGTFVNDKTITGGTSAATCVGNFSSYEEGNMGGMLKLLFYPVPYRLIRLDCDVILRPWDMVNDTDEPLIPEDYRDSIIFGACADLASFLSKPEEVNRYELLYRERINQMAGELIPSTEQFVQIIPDNIRRQYDGGGCLILDREEY